MPGTFRGGTLVGVLGMRPVEMLARGRHFHADDRVTWAGERGCEVGRALLEYAERDAGRRGLGAVFLDSRREVVWFYEHLGHEPHTALLMRKYLVQRFTNASDKRRVWGLREGGGYG